MAGFSGFSRLVDVDGNVAIREDRILASVE
jgi:hypothetical protein